MATRALSRASRCRLLSLAAAALLPGTVAAQASPTLAPPPVRGLRVSPFVGWATGATRKESWHFADGAGNRVTQAVDMDLADGPAAGVVVELPLRGPLHLLAGLTYVDRDDAEFTLEGGERWVFTGSRNIFVRAGAGLQLRKTDEMTVRRLAATVFVAPFYLLELPKEISSIEDSDLFDAAHHFGLGFGVNAELPFAQDRFAFQLGFEDYLTLWDEARLARLPDWLHDAPSIGATTVDADLTHQLLLRAGLSIRLR